MSKKSYWQEMSVQSDRDRTAIKSWFGVMAEGMTPYKAEVLCDIETDREKKIRAFMTDSANVHYQFERTKGRNFSITSKRIDAPVQHPLRGRQ